MNCVIKKNYSKFPSMFRGNLPSCAANLNELVGDKVFLRKTHKLYAFFRVVVLWKIAS